MSGKKETKEEKEKREQREKEEAQYSCKLYSPTFFQLCFVGGACACGSTHLFVTPLDVVKCRLQADPKKYGSIIKGFGLSLREGGLPNLVKGWAPTLIGYSIQGGFKFSLYEFFKWKFASMVDEESAYLYRTYLYLAASACAELLADITLCPFEATKVRMQTTPCFTSRMSTAMPHMLRTEGFGVFYRGLVPLWGRQVPYTMMKFSSFEKTVEYLYANVVPKSREQCTKSEQLMVTFSAGYIAGVLCAVVSHPSDTLVSKMNKDPDSSVGGLIRELGFRGLWGGLVARIIMIGTLTGLQWFVYDGFKVYTGMPRPLPGEMPESLKNKEAAEAKKKEEEEKKKTK